MEFDYCINKIMEHTNLTCKVIQNKGNEIKKEFKGLTSDVGAMFILAKRLNLSWDIFAEKNQNHKKNIFRIIKNFLQNKRSKKEIQKDNKNN